MDSTSIIENKHRDFWKFIKSKTFLKFILPLVIVVGIVIVAGGYYYYRHFIAVDSQTASQAEVQDLVKKVSKLIMLPSNESPTVATVSDPSKLSNQAFFANSQKGDKVLIYTSSKKAILYRPSTNKIVEVAPISLGNSPGSSTSPQPAK